MATSFMIQVYKSFSGIDKLNSSGLFVVEDGGGRTLSHSRKTLEQRCRLDVRKYSFSHSLGGGFLELIA